MCGVCYSSSSSSVVMRSNILSNIEPAPAMDMDMDSLRFKLRVYTSIAFNATVLYSESYVVFKKYNELYENAPEEFFHCLYIHITPIFQQPTQTDEVHSSGNDMASVFQFLVLSSCYQSVALHLNNIT